MELPFALNIQPRLPKRRDFQIGMIGTGTIVNKCHLPAYRKAGFSVRAIAARKFETTRAVAEKFQIPKPYETCDALLADPGIEILDLAVPPHAQLEIVRKAVRQPHIRGILCQKPLAVRYAEARRIVELCRAAGIKLAVNSNMRYDQSIRALKSVLDRRYLGQPIMATIEMRRTPGWKPFLQGYGRLELLNMGIHHIDTFRYLFGEPEKVTAVVRRDPRIAFEHIDGMGGFALQYGDGLLAASLEDAWAWGGDGIVRDDYIKWRVEGTEGTAQGSLNWIFFPELVPSTIAFSSKKCPGQLFRPEWEATWFPDAFTGTMAQLLCAVEEDAVPLISGEDHLKTLCAVEACYASIMEQRTIRLPDMWEQLQRQES